VAVVTMPDKPAGRGLNLQQSAVKQYALQQNIPVLQPEKLKNPDFIEELRSYKADLQVVVAFRMLPVIVWDMPPMGTINVHASLLPHYRGAAPINWAIINGEKETGITTFKLQHEIDTGDILLQEKVAIEATETIGTLHDKLKDVGANLLVETVKGLANNSIKEQPQASFDLSSLKHAPKIFTETCKIDWNAGVQDIYNLIRGLNPYPAAFTTLHDRKVKLFDCSIEENDSVKQVLGEAFTDGKTVLKFAAKDGYIVVKELQMEGKKRMKTDDFLRGYRWP
jgi:methionyl-tRNA formyltransferase